MKRWLDERSGREVWLLDARSVEEWPEVVPWKSAGFALFFAGSRVVAADELAERAVLAGLAYVCAWGPGCALIEEAFDEAIVPLSSRTETTDNVILTSSHEGESLEEALEIFLDASEPAKDRVATCKAWVVLALEGELAVRVRKALERRGAKPVS